MAMDTADFAFFSGFELTCVAASLWFRYWPQVVRGAGGVFRHPGGQLDDQWSGCYGGLAPCHSCM